MTPFTHVAIATVIAPLMASAGLTAQAPVGMREAPPALDILHDGPGGGWSAVRIRSGSTAVDAYLAHDQRTKPVVILLQGSGCMPAFTIDADATYRPTSLFQDVVSPALDRVHFAIVEKRGVSPLQFQPGMTQAQKVTAFERASTDCGSAFFENATKEGRVADVCLLMETLAAQPWVTGFVLVGHSEGTHVASGVLRTDRSAPIRAAGLFASAGPTPFWGGRYSTSDSTARRDFERNLDRLQAVRQNATRPVRYVVVQGGDHAFETAPGMSRVSDLFGDFLKWALDSNHTTGTRIPQ